MRDYHTLGTSMAALKILTRPHVNHRLTLRPTWEKDDVRWNDGNYCPRWQEDRRYGRWVR